MSSCELSHAYRRFALIEAGMSSPLYAAWAEACAESEQILTLLRQLPKGKQQPNLLFAAVRLHLGEIIAKNRFEERVIENWDIIRNTIMRRNTQTNEVARCGYWLPILSQIHGPIALIELGASAGLCLLLDKYRYVYGQEWLEPRGQPHTYNSSILIKTVVSGAGPQAKRYPEIA
nr:DUF2332 family protein [Pseudovibrio hongkongensis]